MGAASNGEWRALEETIQMWRGGCGGLGLPGVGMERFGGGPSSWEERGSGGMEGCLKWSGGLW